MLSTSPLAPMTPSKNIEFKLGVFTVPMVGITDDKLTGIFFLELSKITSKYGSRSLTTGFHAKLKDDSKPLPREFSKKYSLNYQYHYHYHLYKKKNSGNPHRGKNPS
ncbi:hypothetical protein AYI68_g2355 [Smittium mucronatum]|uniref:Uncharacterized protein n=1 Tax=Smittium mucronatum TaxID=133383 RepID=A0A1R0H343_9FUNG|nr:hypothetical protein AYI68_g2355 [Smittium mucronatum]